MSVLNRFRNPVWRTNLLTVAVAVVVCLAVMEGGVRLWAHRLASPEVASLIAGTGPVDERGRFVRHPYLNYALRPDYVSPNGKGRHNAAGMHDNRPVSASKPPGEFRIAAIGGSTTYGVGLGSGQEAYPARLEQVLRESYGLSNVRVLNLGAPGYSSWDSLVNVAFRGADLAPDLVINFDGINDIHARILRPERYVGDATGHRRQWDASALGLDWLESPSYLVRFVALHLARLKQPRIEDVVWRRDMPWRPAGEGVDPRLGMTPMEALRANPPKYFRHNLSQMVAMQRANGGETVLLTFPSQPVLASEREKYVASAHYQAAIAEQNEVVRKLAAELRTPVVDMAAQMPGDPVYWQGDGVHLTAAGSRRFAEILAAEIHVRVAAMIARRR